MGRPLRVDLGGYVYHVLNRANARRVIFQKPADYEAFEKVLRQAQDRTGMRLLAWCQMPTHWHLMLSPRHDGDLSEFMGWLTLTHTQRWHAHHETAGQGHLYQGRYKSFLVHDEDYLATVCRYVERNALRGGLVNSAEDWRWSSLWWWSRRRLPESDQPVLSNWPVDRPSRWTWHVNQPQTQDEIEAIRRHMNRGSPFGPSNWVNRMVKQFGLETTVRPRGRPRKKAEII